MDKIKKQTFQVKALLATNILTVILLVIICFKSHYLQTIYQKLSGTLQEWNYKENIRYVSLTAAYPLYTEQKNIVMLGNSLTDYAEWSELLNRPDVANRGIGSDVTAGFIERLNYIINIRPRICFIEGGVNDLSKGVSQNIIIKNLSSIIDNLQINGIRPVLTTVTLVAEQRRNAVEFNRKIKQLNMEIVKLAQKKNVKLIDLNQYVSNESFLISEYAVKDGIHFTKATYLIWKQEVEKILKEETW
jgi:lysophospholipase L1-like esterase